MTDYVHTAIGLAKQGLLTVLALGLFAGFGPPTIPLPTAPVAIRDVHETFIAAPAPPLEGPFAPNTILDGATVLFNNTIQSSESVLVNDDGSLLLLDKYGRAFVATPDSTAPGGFKLSEKPLAQLGPGRPLGFKKHLDGSIIVCNAGLGLVKLDLPDPSAGSPARVTLLGSYVTADSPQDPGTQIMYANDLAISADGSAVYFTDSQVVPVVPNWGVMRQRQRPWYDTYTSFLMGLYSGQATGRLLAYYPNNGSIHVLSKGMWFPNGVALSPDEDYLVVAETNMFRLLRYWIKGEKAGTVEVFTDGLPGFPDGVNLAKGGKGFWVAMPSPHSKLFDIAVRWRIIRVIFAWMPAHVRPPVPTWGAAVLVSPEGEVTQFLLGTRLTHLSDVEEEQRPGGGSRIWFGSIRNHYIAYLDV